MKFKSTILNILVSFCIILLLPQTVFAADTVDTYSFGHFYYHSHEGYISICGYLGSETDIEIPSSIAGKPVSEIESGSFVGCNSVQSITVPDTVVMVYADSFSGANQLTKITSYTVDVNIQAGSGVSVEYKNESNTDSLSPSVSSTDSLAPVEPQSDSQAYSAGDVASNKTNDPSLGDFSYEETDEDLSDSNDSNSKGNFESTLGAQDSVLESGEISDTTQDAINFPADSSKESFFSKEILIVIILAVVAVLGSIVFAFTKKRNN